MKFLWKAIWRAWRRSMNALPTKDNLWKKKMNVEPHCLFCEETIETVENLICVCSRAGAVWFSRPLAIQGQKNHRENFLEWVADLAGSLSRESFDLALMLIWSLWTQHNSLIWQGKALNPLEINCKMVAWLQEFHKWHGRDKKSRVHMVRPWISFTGRYVAAREGVVMASQAVLAHVEFEGDALMVIKALQHEGFDDNSIFWHIIADT
ncbi:hypothetical protein DVH24_010048 [Malus domestica]|uniref:Reverse transcriptase zinc-binding domain-containing protein n=1 Tax=Malus domestica TaxID=3750 RepID=A0A498JUW9_MALDO|nr:hypothetical protein DVH24_010048 [Malus domestica]